MNHEDLMQQVANRDYKPVTNHSVGERERVRSILAADVDAFLAKGGKIKRSGILVNNKPTTYNTTYGVNAK
jgi:hypothetical protein